MILFLLLFVHDFSYAKIVHYDLTIQNQPVNLSGKKEIDFSLTVNGSIPAPTLEFTEGDEADITVHNALKDPHEEVSIHWHGILLPPLEDGVPYVNTPPIHPGTSRTFRFPLRQNGTYWYHSHTMLQEQKGVYGAFIIRPKQEPFKINKDVVAVLSDWSDENADRILSNLKKDGDYYQFKKGTIRSYFDALAQGKLSNQLRNEWTRMGGMDLSDVGYDAFLINGKRNSQLIEAVPGEKIRLRIINAAASTYFYVSLGDIPMTVVAADGKPIEPIQTQKLLMGMAETYDVLIRIPENKNYELRVTSQDGTGYASGFIGSGKKVLAPEIPKPDLYATMNHSAHGDHHGSHPTHSHATPLSIEKVPLLIPLLTVDSLKATTSMDFPKNGKVHDLKLVLNGDMRRYVWHINGKTIRDDRLLVVNPGETVRITYENRSMMHHPMHLHGHFFRVLNKNGSYSPWKHTVDVPPMGTRTIEFYTDETGQWMLHCHNLYHMDSGMARVVRYSNFLPTGEMASLDRRDHHLMDPWYTLGRAEISSNHMQADFRVSQTWNEFSARIESANIKGRNFDYDLRNQWDYESDLFYRRWVNNWTSVILGGTLYGERFHGAIGFGHFFPMMIETRFLVNHEGQFRFDLERKFQWTKKIYSDLDLSWRPGGQHGKHEVEIEISLMYAPTWSWAAGLMLTNDSLGAGIESRF